VSQSIMEDFYSLLRIEGFEKNKYDELYPLFSLKKYCKKEYFQHAGEAHDFIGVVKEGIFRFFYVDHKGKERTKHLVTAGGFLFSISSYVSGCELSFSIQSLSDSTIYIASLESLRKVINDSENLQKLYYHHLQEMYILKEKREESFLLKTPVERYNDFISQYRNLFNSIPQQYVASYLGIDPVSLSRIRGKIQKS